MRTTQYLTLAYATAVTAAPAALNLPGLSSFNLPSLRSGSGSKLSFPAFPGLSKPAKASSVAAPAPAKSSVASRPASTIPQPSAIASVVPVPSAVASIVPVPSAVASVAPIASPSAAASSGEDINCVAQPSAGGSTENGIASQYCCTDVTIVFARGTGETGNVGTVAGPPFFKALRGRLGAGRVTVQGTEYPATWAVSLLYSD